MKPWNTYMCVECQEITDNPRQCPACVCTALIGLWEYIPVFEPEAVLMSSQEVMEAIFEDEEGVA